MPLKRFKNVDISPNKGPNKNNERIPDLSVNLERYSSTINTGNDTESFSDEENTYFIEETHTEGSFPLKTHPFTARNIAVKTELDDFENRKTENEVDQDLDQKSTIKSEEENFINNQYLIDHEEVDIKSEDDGEQSDTQHTLKDQIKTHKCPDCPFQSKHTWVVKQHLIRHRKSDEIMWYRCTECSYKTALKGNLKRHAVTHNEKGQLETFKCGQCDFESSRKQSLQRHLLVHNGKNMPQIHCPELGCPYKTHDKSRLKSHSHVHSKDKVFKCTECSYRAKRQRYLKRHQLRHINHPEEAGYIYHYIQLPLENVL